MRVEIFDASCCCGAPSFLCCDWLDGYGANPYIHVSMPPGITIQNSDPAYPTPVPYIVLGYNSITGQWESYTATNPYFVIYYEGDYITNDGVAVLQCNPGSTPTFTLEFSIADPVTSTVCYVTGSFSSLISLECDITKTPALVAELGNWNFTVISPGTGTCDEAWSDTVGPAFNSYVTTVTPSNTYL